MKQRFWLTRSCSEAMPYPAVGDQGLMTAAARPQQLDDLLRVLPGIARRCAVAEAVQDFADLLVRLALTPQFDGLGGDLGVNGPQAFGDDVLGLLESGRLTLDCVSAGQAYHK